MVRSRKYIRDAIQTAYSKLEGPFLASDLVESVSKILQKEVSFQLVGAYLSIMSKDSLYNLERRKIKFPRKTGAYEGAYVYEYQVVRR